MIRIYVKLIRKTSNGRLETFRTTKPHYLPQGYELVKDIESFEVGVPDKPVEPVETEKPAQFSSGCIVLMSCAAIAFVVLFYTLFYGIFDV